MTEVEWLAQAARDADSLRSLLSCYHPSAGLLAHGPKLPITAPGAENACVEIRKEIQRTEIPEVHLTRISPDDLFSAIRRFQELTCSDSADLEVMFLLVVATDGLEPAIEEWTRLNRPYQRPLQVLREAMSERDDNKGDPVTRFNAALSAGDVGAIMTVLNEAWFGVPESTSCWRIQGFAEAVGLLEAPLDDDREPPHPDTCICADCSGAELTAEND